MKHKFLSIVIALSMLMSAVFALPVSAENDISVKLDGKTISFDVPPQIINDRTMVPLRAVFEALGASVDWDSGTRTVVSEKDGIKISLTIDSSVMYVNGNAVTLDSPACVIDDRTLVPIRAISEAYNANVEWDNATRTVIITSAAAATAPALPANTEDIQNNSSSAVQFNEYSSNVQCYPGTDVPTYTEVTGAKLLRTNTLKDGTPYYVYKYTDADTVALFWKKLYSLGWTSLSGDNASTNTIFESSFYNGDMLVLVDVMLSVDEVWITISTVE